MDPSPYASENMFPERRATNDNQNESGNKKAFKIPSDIFHNSEALLNARNDIQPPIARKPPLQLNAINQEKSDYFRSKIQNTELKSSALHETNFKTPVTQTNLNKLGIGLTLKNINTSGSASKKTLDKSNENSTK
jgi:hypothetical protein